MNPRATPTPNAEDPRRNRRQWLRAAGAACLAGGLAACGGGGDDSGTRVPQDERRRPLGGVDSGGTGSPMMAMLSASITSGTPFTVGGSTLDTTGTVITDADGRPQGTGDLLPGRTCRVEVDGTRARSVRLGDQLLGPVSAVDLARGRIGLLGQSVLVTGSTRFDAALAGGLSGVRAGQVLRVWGQLDEDSERVVATRVEPAVAGRPWTVRGVLRQLDRSTGRLRIGSLDTALADGATADASLAPGQVVRATLQPLGGALVVTTLLGDALQAPEGRDATIEGRVTDLSDGGLRFAVDGVAVDASAAAFEGAGTLRSGDRVEVRGRVVGGVLQALEVELVVEELYETEGTVGSADAAARSFTLRGLTVTWDASTRFEGGSAALLAARRKVSVKGRLSADRLHLHATLIHVES